MLRSLLWSFIEQGGSKAANLLIQLVLARLLAPNVFGLLAILLVFVNLADSVAQSGMGTALIQREGAVDSDYSTAFWLSLGLAAALYFVLWAASPAIGSFYGMEELAAPLRAISLTFVFNSVNSIQRSYLQRSLDFRTLAIANVAAIAVAGVVGVACAAAGLGVWALVAQSVSQGLAACVALFLLSPWRPSPVFDAESARQLYSYGWKICVTGILGTLYTSVSELILGRTCSASDLGLYSQGRKWPNAAISLFTNALQNVFLPAFSALQGDREALRASMRRFLVAGSFLAVPVSVLAAIVSEPAVGLLLGEAWLPCAPVFRWTCLGNAVVMLQLVNLRAYMALGRSDLYLVLQAVKVAIGVAVAAVVAVLTRDISSVALATMLVGLFNIIVIDMAPARRVHGYMRSEQLKDWVPSVLASCAASAAALVPAGLGLDSYPLLLFCETALFAAVYLFLARFFRVKGLAEVVRLVERITRH